MGAYQSVDQLQKVLVQEVFHYAKDAKKAAGRALGTLVEIVTFYMLKSWGFEHSVAIERPLAEYGNSEINHNVEYSLHPILREHALSLPNVGASVTANRILRMIDQNKFSTLGFEQISRLLLTGSAILRNSCVIAHGPKSHLIVTLDRMDANHLEIVLLEQSLNVSALELRKE
jgi:hypothetical protein